MRNDLLLVVTLAVVPLAAQSPGAFDVISIKPNRTGAEAADTNTSPGRVSFINVTPLSLLRRAFGVQDYQIVDLPDWASTERYDVVALVDQDLVLNDRDRQPFLQRMLIERWNLRSHQETRTHGIYRLVVADVSKLVLHTGPGEYGMKVELTADGILLRSTRGNIGRLVEILSRYVDRVVVDETGLTGEYDFTLEWIQNPGSAAGGPTLFTALRERLGLRLEPVDRRIPVIVIDHIDRPSDN